MGACACVCIFLGERVDNRTEKVETLWVFFLSSAIVPRQVKSGSHEHLRVAMPRQVP